MGSQKSSGQAGSEAAASQSPAPMFTEAGRKIGDGLGLFFGALGKVFAGELRKLAAVVDPEDTTKP